MTGITFSKLYCFSKTFFISITSFTGDFKEAHFVYLELPITKA